MRWLDSMRCWNSCNTGCSSLVVWLASLVRLVSHVVRISSVVCPVDLFMAGMRIYTVGDAGLDGWTYLWSELCC